MKLAPRFLLRAVGTAIVLALPVPVATVAVSYPTAAVAKAEKPAKLPTPYVSKALGAVLMEVTPEVRKQFMLKKKKQGVLILSVQPGGPAAKRGLKVGDVIDNVKQGAGKAGKVPNAKKTKGKKVRKPQDLDAVLLYWLNDSYDRFYFVGSSNGLYFANYAEITLDDYYYPYDLASVSTWDAEWYGASYAYGEYSYSYSEVIETYSTEISESYEYSETYSSEVFSSEEFISEVSESQVEMTEEEVASEEFANVDLPDDPEETFPSDDASALEEITDDADLEGADEAEVGEAVADVTDETVEEPVEDVTDEAVEESAEEVTDEADEELVEEEAYEEVDEEPAEEEAYEEPAEEMAEESYEEPAAEESYEEPAAEETYEEPAYEEPAYEEPSGDGGACCDEECLEPVC